MSGGRGSEQLKLTSCLLTGIPSKPGADGVSELGLGAGIALFLLSVGISISMKESQCLSSVSLACLQLATRARKLQVYKVGSYGPVGDRLSG